MRIAYADPPYPGRRCARYYPENAEVDHAELLVQLCSNFPDGWALSTSSPALRGVLQLCPHDVRVAAWVKPFCSYKPGVNPAYAWEPVIFRGGRTRRARTETTVRDFVSANILIQKGLTGAKPPQFCTWLFDLLGLRPGDELVDLFPGTGAVSRAWEHFCTTQNTDSHES